MNPSGFYVDPKEASHVTEKVTETVSVFFVVPWYKQ